MLLLASAGLSFIPSPHIITYLPSVFSFFTTSVFSRGVTFDITVVMPISLAIFSAVCVLSPVSITVSILFLFSLLITSFEFSLTISFTPIIAEISLFSTT